MSAVPRGFWKGTGGWGAARFLFLLYISIHSSDILPNSTPFPETPQSHPRISNLGRKTMQDSSNMEWKTAVLGTRLGSSHWGSRASIHVEDWSGMRVLGLVIPPCGEQGLL